MTEILRTPDSQFENLPGFPYQPNYIKHKDARIHYLDEGEGEVILCLHGEPSWSYLYRKFIPVLMSSYRVVAPDFIGFGRSDKYANQESYTFKMHFDMLKDFIEQLDLQKITVVVQDWGGLLGLSVLGAIPERFARVVIMNTTLPTGSRPIPVAFKLWQTFAKYHPNLPIGGIIKSATVQPLSPEVKAAYNAPFPSKKYKTGAKVFPVMVPTKVSDPGIPEMKKAREILKQWQKPALVMFSDKDKVMRGADKWFRKNIPTANDQPFIEIKDAGHFLQEDKGEEIAEQIKQFMERTKL